MRNTAQTRSPLFILQRALLFVLIFAASGRTGSIEAQDDPQVAATLQERERSEILLAVIQGIRPRGYDATAYWLLEAAPDRVTYFVAPTGSDNNPGTSLAPFRTINRAAQVAVAGDVVTIRDGIYQESVTVRNGGTATAPIVFQAENRGGVVLTGGQFNFQPIGWTGGLMNSGAIYVTVKGLIFREYASLAGGGEGTALRGAKGWRIEDCLFDAPGETGLDLRGDDIVLTQSTLQFAAVHAFVAWGPANLATSPTDPKFVGIKNLRVTDVIIRGNHTSTKVQAVGHGSAVVKILGSQGALIENVDSYENYGPGLWFDSANFGYVVRNSYFHDNLSRGDGHSPGRGLHLEISWHGLVEWNVFANNADEGLAINNSSGVTARNNLFVGNRRQIVLSNWDRGAPFWMKDIRIEQNQFRDWREHGAIEVLGNINPSNLSSLNITVDYNIYQPIRSDTLSGWWGYFAKTIEDTRAKLGWERNGSVAPIAWPR